MRGGAPDGAPDRGPDRPEDAVGEELSHHLELRAREIAEAEGLAPHAARREAERRFGDRERIEVACARIQRRIGRRRRRRGMMDGWTQELVQAARGLRRTPVVTGAALLTLALGVGANTAVFSVVRGVLLRPLPFPEPEELYLLREVHPVRGPSHVSPANYLDWRARVGGYASLAAFDRRTANLLDGGPSIRVGVGLVSGSFFHTLGVEPAVGRAFDPELRLDPGLRQVLLGHALWRDRFGADPSWVGRTVRIDDASYEVLGVMPPGFDFPGGSELWMRAQRDVPGVPGLAGDHTTIRGAWYFDVVARVRDGVSAEAAEEELAALADALAEAHPDNEGRGARAVPLRETLVGESRTLLGLLLGAVGLVLLTACANVASLVLARAEGRRHDLAVRSALGASGGRLLRLMVAEGVVLAAAGAVLGWGVAAVGLPGLTRLLPPDLPRSGEIALDGPVLVFTLGVAVSTCLLFAAAPALAAWRTRPASALADRSGEARGRSGSRIRRGLVVAEVAIAAVLAASAGLLVRSVAGMTGIDPGYRPEGLATGRVSLPSAGSLTEAERLSRWEALAEALDRLPAVERAGVGRGSPVETGPQAGLRLVGLPDPSPDASPSVVWMPATPGWLETLGVAVLRGRGIQATDRLDAPPVAVVSESLVRRFFPEADPLGRRVTIGLDAGHDIEITIVGVAQDVRNRGPTEAPVPVLYRPLAQAGDFGGRTMSFAARTAGDPARLHAALARAVRSVDPEAVVHGAATGPELARGFTERHRFVLGLVGLFAVLAVGLGAVGIYGVTSHAVARRRREIGVRMAMGAGRSRVVGLVLRQGLAVTGAGVAAGVLAAAAAGRLLSSLLFQVRPTDPLTLGAVAAVLFLVAGAALALPARQAAGVDPAGPLRSD